MDATDTDVAAYQNAVRDYATRALQAALDDDAPDEAARLISELAREWGALAPVYACMAWADTYIERVGIPPEVRCSDIAFVDETGRIDSAAEAPATWLWAARWLLARRDMDEGAARALMGELSSDEEWSQVIVALLDIVSHGLRQGSPTLGDVLLRAATQDPGRGDA